MKKKKVICRQENDFSGGVVGVRLCLTIDQASLKLVAILPFQFPQCYDYYANFEIAFLRLSCVCVCDECVCICVCKCMSVCMCMYAYVHL